MFESVYSTSIKLDLSKVLVKNNGTQEHCVLNIFSIKLSLCILLPRNLALCQGKAIMPTTFTAHISRELGGLAPPTLSGWKGFEIQEHK